MKDLNIPFSLFDFFAVLLPGGVGLFGFYLLLNPTLGQAAHDAIIAQSVLRSLDSDLALMTSLIVASYLVGLVFGGLSELLIDKPANLVFGADIVRDLSHHNVDLAVRREFGDDIVRQSRRRTFVMMESTVDAKLPDAGAIARRFIALAVMFQSLTFGLLLVAVALVRGYWIDETPFASLAGLLLGVALLLMGSGLTLWSYRRYKRLWSLTVAMAFVTWSMLGARAEMGHQPVPSADPPGPRTGR